jgi:hypothetical protein
MSFWDRMLNIPEKYIHAVLFIALIVPLLYPLGLPISIHPLTRTYYEDLDALEPGTRILAPYDGSPGTEMEISLSAAAVMRHLFTKDVKMVFVSIAIDAPPLFERILKSEGFWDTYQEGYGTKYVYLGYIPGYENACAAFAGSIRKSTGGTDFYGTPFEQLPIMADFETGADFDILVGTDEPGINSVYWMNQVAVPFNLPMYSNPLAAVAAQYHPYVEAGQMKSMLIGAKAAAGYEYLSGLPGRALASMDAQSMGHLYQIIVFVIVNIALLGKYLSGSGRD